MRRLIKRLNSLDSLGTLTVLVLVAVVLTTITDSVSAERDPLLHQQQSYELTKAAAPGAAEPGHYLRP